MERKWLRNCRGIKFAWVYQINKRNCLVPKGHMISIQASKKSGGRDRLYMNPCRNQNRLQYYFFLFEIWACRNLICTDLSYINPNFFAVQWLGMSTTISLSGALSKSTQPPFRYTGPTFIAPTLHLPLSMILPTLWFQKRTEFIGWTTEAKV